MGEWGGMEVKGEQVLKWLDRILKDCLIPKNFCFFFKRQTHFMTTNEEILEKVSLSSNNADLKKNRTNY